MVSTERRIAAKDAKLIYRIARPGSERDIGDAYFCEREGFQTLADPQEMPAVLRFLAKKGEVLLQYSQERGKKIPTGVMETIFLDHALKFNHFRYRGDLSKSPLKMVIENQERVFQSVRKLASDRWIVYHHGIAVVRKGMGYGKLLLEHIMDGRDKFTFFCAIDGATKKSGNLELIPNEVSIRLHMKAGFLLTGVIDPPVYDTRITYYAFVRPGRGMRFLAANPETVNLAEGNGQEVISKIKELTSKGYVGTDYDISTHEMKFWPSF